MKCRLLIIIILQLAGAACFLAATSGTAGPASGQSSDPVDALAADAVAHNPSLQAQRQAILAARQAMVRAGALPDPTVEVEWMNIRLPVPDPVDALTTGVGVGISQMLPAGDKRRAEQEAARAEAAATRARLEEMEATLAADVRESAYRLATVRQLLELQDRLDGALAGAAQAALAAYSVGRGSQADVLASQAAVTRVSITREDLRRQEAVILAQLDGLTGRPAHRGTVDAVRLADPTELPPLDSLLARLDREAPAVRLARSEAGIADAGIVRARADFKSDTMVGVGARFRDMSMGGDSFLAVRLGFTLPFLHRNDRYRPALEEALRLQAGARLEARQALVDARYRLTAAWQSAASAQRTVSLYRDGLLLQGRLAYESALAAYSAQQVDFDFLIQTLTAYFDWQGMEIVALGGYQEAMARAQAVLPGLRTNSPAEPAPLPAPAGSAIPLEVSP